MAIHRAFAASGDHCGRIHLWRLDGENHGSVFAELDGAMSGLAFTEDGTVLLSAGEDIEWFRAESLLLGAISR